MSPTAPAFGLPTIARGVQGGGTAARSKLPASGKRTAENPTALEAKVRDIQSQPTWTGKATKTAGTVAGHFIAQVLGVVVLIMMPAGVALGVAGYLWR